MQFCFHSKVVNWLVKQPGINWFYSLISSFLGLTKEFQFPNLHRNWILILIKTQRNQAETNRLFTKLRATFPSVKISSFFLINITTIAPNHVFGLVCLRDALIKFPGKTPKKKNISDVNSFP